MADQNAIRTFMTPFRSENDMTYTHTSQMQPFTGRFNIERPNIEDFWKFYCDNLYSKGDQFFSGLSEKPHSYMPILGDIDLSVAFEEDKDFSEQLYTQQQLDTVVSIYIDVLKHIINGLDYDNLYCFILEKKKPYQNGPVIKNGFHIHFPFLYLSVVDQEMHLIPRVAKEVEDRKIFEHLMQYSGEAIDKGVVKKHWLLYGSRKDSKLEAYTLTKIVNYAGKEVQLGEVMKTNRIYNAEEEIIDCLSGRHPVNYYLPRILSVHPLNRPVYTIKENIEVIVKQKLIKVKEIKGTYDNMPLSEAVQMTKRLTVLLNPKRASTYESWMEIGWILYNIGEGCYESLQIWLDFSKKTTRGNYNEATCVYEWNKMYKSNYTLGSLKHHAAMDNPEGYGQFLMEEKEKRIQDSLNGGHFDLARQLYDVYGQHYVCASLEKDLWFEYKNHRWIKDEKGIELKRKIAACLIPRYRDAAKGSYDDLEVQPEERQQQRIVPHPGQDVNDGLVGKVKKINTIIGHLNTSGFKQSVMKECQELFYKADFFEKLDDNPYLLGFANGVLDLKNCTFRAGRPDDYISLTTGYDYKEYKPSDIEIQDIDLFLEKIFVNEACRNYFVQYAATLLRGGNFQKTFVIMSGEGDNGKSVVIELIEKALGKYMIKFPTTLLTGKRAQSSAANPELDRIQGKRFAVMQEPDSKDVINVGMLKELTGNDSIYVRGLFKDGRDVMVTFKLALICNHLPHIPANEAAAWNRTRVLPFDSFFPKDNALVPETYEEQKEKKIFPRDNNFSEKLPFMRAPFMWYIFQKYKEICRIGISNLVDPPEVTEATRLYRENNDVFLQFINENIKPDTTPDNQGLSLTELYNVFKEWFNNTYTGLKLPNKIEFRDDIGKKWGKPLIGRWKNYRFRNALDDEEDENVTTFRDEDYA